MTDNPWSTNTVKDVAAHMDFMAKSLDSHLDVVAASPEISQEPAALQDSVWLPPQDGPNLNSQTFAPTQDVQTPLQPSKPFLESVSDAIQVQILPEKQGFVFKHVRYHLKSAVGLFLASFQQTHSVNRRYSDFVWLHEMLLRKFLCRTGNDLIFCDLI